MGRKPAEAPSGHIAPALRQFAVPMDTLTPDPANVRRHPDRNLDAIRASLVRFGQQTPIVADGAGVIRKGNGTYLAAKALGWATIAAVETPLAGSEATGYAIADNRTAELAEWDGAALAETLRALDAEGFELEAAGYTAADLDGMLGPGGEEVADPGAEWDGMPECENEDCSIARSLIVHFEDEADVPRFGAMIGQPIPEKLKYIHFPPRPLGTPSANPYVDEP